MANILKQIKVGNTTYNIEPYTNYLPLAGGAMTGPIYYQGTKAKYAMIKWIDNTADNYGNGIRIGGGGATIIGGGESADLPSVSGGDEILYLMNDGNIDFYSNCQDGLSSAKHMSFDTSGTLNVPTNIAGSSNSNRLIFRHLDGQNCNGNYDLYLQYHQRNTKIYLNGTDYYIENGSYYNGTAASAGNADTLDGSHASAFATAGHSHSNYVTTDTDQTISGAKTFSNTITANNWLYVPYIGTKTNKLYIEGPWSQNGQEQPTLSFEDGALKAYNWEDDGDSVYESMFYFNFPYGVRMNANSSSMYLNGNNGCYLQSTSNGWMVDGSDTYGCIYPAANHNGKIGLPANHFYQGYINYIYSGNIVPIAYNGSSSASNYGAVGTTSNYFGSGAFRTVYRSSESGLSDIRLKQNISNNDLNALEIINNLNIINFQYDDDIKIEARNKKQRLKAINTMKELPKTKETKELRKELQKIIATPNNEDMITIGVSAQQLQELLPKKYQKTFIQKESTNQYADQLFIKENRLVYLSFKAIQEQQTIIDSLEAKINLLEEKINALEEKMKKEVN